MGIVSFLPLPIDKTGRFAVYLHRFYTGIIRYSFVGATRVHFFRKSAGKTQIISRQLLIIVLSR